MTTLPQLIDVVEDDPGHRKLFSLLVEVAGFRVRRFLSAAAALHAMQDELPVASIIDVQLGGEMDGLQLIREIRRNRELAGIVTIVVSAHAAPVDEARARAAGADHWLTKPVDTQLLIQLLQSLRDLPGDLGGVSGSS